MGDLGQHLRYAVRQLRAAPGFAATAILTLALGIGANTAIFSLVNNVIFRPLPFAHADRLYGVYSANRTAGLLQGNVSPVDLDDWRTMIRTGPGGDRPAIDDLGGYFYAEGSTGVSLTGRGQPQALSAVFVTPGFFETLGVTPAAGRLPREDELVRGGPDRVVMLTHAFWTREFGASPSIVGASITLKGEPYHVLGVLPADFRFPTDQADVFVPYSTIPDSGIPRIRPVRVLRVVARAREGVTLSTVAAQMNAIAQQLGSQYPEDGAWDATTVLPLHEIVTGPVRRGLLVLLGAVGFVLLAACVNVAGLQLARAMGRRREMGVRVALGAGRARLASLVLVESLLLSAIGGVAGLVLARGIVSGLLALGQSELPRAAEVRLDGTVAAFSVVLSILTGLLCGLVPALRAASSDIQPLLREGGRGSAGPGRERLRMGLVVAEVALAVILVVGAGLMARSFSALLNVDSGFRPDHLIAVQFTLDPSRGSSPAQGATAPPAYALLYEQIIEKVRALPGVVSAAAVKDPPFRGVGERNGFNLPRRTTPPGQDPPSAMTIHVSYGYFATIGASIVDGREFTPRDRPGTPLVVVINEAFARRYFPGERAVGQKLIAGRSTPVEIIGVVHDIRQVAVAEPAEPTMYLHNLQNSRVKTTIVARTVGDPLSMTNAIRDAVWSLEPTQPITAVFTFDDVVSRALARPRLLTVLLAAFGVVGLGLGALGLYGVLSFLVQQRRREIGVRLTLGARPAEVRWLFVRRGLLLTAAGVATGLIVARLMSQSLAAVLYGVAPTDAATFVGVAMVLFLSAAAASWLPARRAARVNPVETLRLE